SRGAPPMTDASPDQLRALIILAVVNDVERVDFIDDHTEIVADTLDRLRMVLLQRIDHARKVPSLSREYASRLGALQKAHRVGLEMVKPILSKPSATCGKGGPPRKWKTDWPRREGATAPGLALPSIPATVLPIAVRPSPLSDLSFFTLTYSSGSPTLFPLTGIVRRYKAS